MAKYEVDRERRRGRQVIHQRRLPRKLDPTVRVLVDNGFVRKDDVEGRAENVVVFTSLHRSVQLARAGEDEGIVSPWSWVLWNRTRMEYTSGQGAISLRKALK